MVLTILALKFDAGFAWITVGTPASISRSPWTVPNGARNFAARPTSSIAAHSKAIDSLLNYETVKYFQQRSF